MTAFACPVCSASLSEPVYRGAVGRSLDSLGRLLPFETRVHCCRSCDHVSTEPIPDLDLYYAENYRISLGSEDDDQLYEMVGNTRVFRTDHQARLLTELVEWQPGARVLDFGCAKASTLRKAMPALPNVELSLYDVSDHYRTHWDTFVPRQRQAVHTLPDDWRGRFDLVTSLFSLEHIATPKTALDDISSLLADEGYLYLVVPDMFTNPGDFVVLDHVNHFTIASLERLLSDAGLTIRWVRNDVHRGALVAMAGKTPNPIPAPRQSPSGDPDKLAEWWNGIAGRVRAIEQRCDGDSAIYGAGFYGSFVYATLENPKRVRCFLDNNPYLQGTQHLSKPILPPADCPPSIRDLWIGLNPLHARRIMAGINLGSVSPRQLHLSEEDSGAID